MGIIAILSIVVGIVFFIIILIASVRIIVYTGNKEKERADSLIVENRKRSEPGVARIGDYYYILESFATAVINYRVRNNLTTQKLAEILDVSPEYIGQIEREEVNLTLKELVELIHKMRGDIKVSITI